MSFLGALFLWLMIWLAYKLIRILFYAHKVKKQTRQMFSQFGQKYSHQSENPTQQPKTEKPRASKKIDPDVGEYVKFEDIEEIVETSTTIDSSGKTTHTTYRKEEQIIDVEWVDLPDENKKD